MEIRILTKKVKFLKIFHYTEIAGFQYRPKFTSDWKFCDLSRVEVMDYDKALQKDHNLPM